jgi:hypothetical protein
MGLCFCLNDFPKAQEQYIMLREIDWVLVIFARQICGNHKFVFGNPKRLYLLVCDLSNIK